MFTYHFMMEVGGQFLSLEKLMNQTLLLIPLHYQQVIAFIMVLMVHQSDLQDQFHFPKILLSILRVQPQLLLMFQHIVNLVVPYKKSDIISRHYLKVYLMIM